MRMIGLWRARKIRSITCIRRAAANGIAGNGALSTTAPAEEKADQYVYDPSDAVPTIGGPLCCGALPTGIGPEDQRPAEARSDVLMLYDAGVCEGY